MRRTGVLPTPAARQAALRIRPLRRTHVPIWVWIGVMGVAIAALLPVLQTSDATATAARLRALDRERAGLQAQVRLQEAQVGELASLTRVEQAARERLQMTPARPTTVLEVTAPPPDRLVPERYLPRRAISDEPSRSWWQRVVDFLIVD